MVFANWLCDHLFTHIHAMELCQCIAKNSSLTSTKLEYQNLSGGFERDDSPLCKNSGALTLFLRSRIETYHSEMYMYNCVLLRHLNVFIVV